MSAEFCAIGFCNLTHDRIHGNTIEDLRNLLCKYTSCSFGIEENLDLEENPKTYLTIINVGRQAEMLTQFKLNMVSC